MAKQSGAPHRHILDAALQGLEAQRQKLDEQIAEVRRMIGRGGRPGTSSSGGGGSQHRSGGGAVTKKRTLSAEARKRIAAAQKKRWAAFRKNQE